MFSTPPADPARRGRRDPVAADLSRETGRDLVQQAPSIRPARYAVLTRTVDPSQSRLPIRGRRRIPALDLRPLERASRKGGSYAQRQIKEAAA